MADKQIDFITNQLARGQSVTAIIGLLKSQGWTEEQIDTGLKAALAKPSTQVSSTPVRQSGHLSFDLHKLDATKTFVLIGILLILIAIIIVMALQWNTAGPTGRVAFVVGPMLLLFTISVIFARNSKYQDIHEGTLATASVIFPFALGTMLYQFSILPELNALLVMICSLAAYVLLVILEFGLHKQQFSILTILFLYTFVAALLAHLKVELLLTLWLMFFLSLAIFALGYALLSNQKKNGGTYAATGVVGSVFLLPACVLYAINQDIPLLFESNAVIASLFGPFYFGLSFGLHALAKQLSSKVMHDLRWALQELAPLILIIPYFAITNKTGYTLLVIILSFTYMFASIYVRLRTLLPVGALGLIIGILILSSRYFVDTIGWPIVIFIAGFAMLGISIFVRKVSAMHNAQNLPLLQYGIGEDPHTAQKKTSFGCLGLLILLLLIPGLFWLVPFLFLSGLGRGF